MKLQLLCTQWHSSVELIIHLWKKPTESQYKFIARETTVFSNWYAKCERKFSYKNVWPYSWHTLKESDRFYEESPQRAFVMDWRFFNFSPTCNDSKTWLPLRPVLEMSFINSSLSLDYNPQSDFLEVEELFWSIYGRGLFRNNNETVV